MSSELRPGQEHPCGFRPAVPDDPHVRVALIAAAALLFEAVMAKNVLDVTLDFVSQFVAMWVFVAYLLSGRRDRLSEVAATTGVLGATAAVLLTYSI